MTRAMSGSCEVAGGRIYFEVEGEGDPVLFIHAGVANLRMWDQQAAALGNRYRVIRFDTRGYGRTDSDHVQFSNRADAAAVLDAVEAWEEAKDWERLTQFETAYWVDGPGQPPGRVPPEIRAMVEDWIDSNYRSEKEAGIPRPLDPPAGSRLDDLRAPLLVILGELDDAETNDAMRHLAATVPGARLESFPTAHMVNLEIPDRFNAVLGEFLDAVRTSA